MGFMYHKGYDLGMFLFKASVFILASFVFSIVFWTTKHWLERKQGKKSKE